MIFCPKSFVFFKKEALQLLRCFFIPLHTMSVQEIVMGGMVVETNQTEILTHIEAQQRIEKQEAGMKTNFLVFKIVRSFQLA